MSILESIHELKESRHAIILAHNYTEGPVQDVADFVGDSLELSRKAAACQAPVIVFCGVRFMAETAKILSPNSIVLHPAPDSGCLMADMVNAAAINAYRQKHPNTIVVAYINTTAETKTAVDICCTSGNAERVIASIPADKSILFLPDGNLGRNIAAKLNRPMEFWPGCCPIHDGVTTETIHQAKLQHPDAEIIVHPECRPEVVAMADAALSTGGMLTHVKESGCSEFIIGTEAGILHRMRQENPQKQFYPLSPTPICHDMKKVTLESILSCLQNLEPRVELDEETIRLARRPIDAMLQI